MAELYYFLGAIIPDIQIGYPPELSFAQFTALLKTNLTPSDYTEVVVMRRYHDLQNIRAFWQGKEISPFGNFNANELEEALLTQSGFPEYVFQFIDKYENSQKRLENFSELIVSYFRHEIADHSHGFLHAYLSFERGWRPVVSGLRAKKLKRDLIRELQFEDPSDDLVAQILAQKDAASYEPPTEFEELRGLFETHGDDPFELHQALCEWRFAKIGELFGLHAFSIDRILGYLAQLIIVEEWMALDQQQGMKLIGNCL